MWYTATKATATNGSKIVTITDGDDVSIIQEKGGLVFEDTSPVEVRRAYLDNAGNKVVELSRPWPYANQSNHPLVVFPTDASFAEATAELRRVIDSLSIANRMDAEAGTDDAKIMTSLKVLQSIVFHVGTGVWNASNTTVDANGFIKQASPIVRLFKDKIEKNDEVPLLVSFQKRGVGDYAIKGSAGFSRKGWYIETPKDANGFPKVLVKYIQESDGTLSIKTYKYNQKGEFKTPEDIPRNRWIDLRLAKVGE